MLGWRLLISAVLVSGITALFYFDHRSGAKAPFLLALCSVLVLRATWESVGLLRTRSFSPSLLLVSGCSLGILWPGWWPHWNQGPYDPSPAPLSELGPPMLCYATCVLILLLAGAVRYDEPGRAMETLGAELLIVSYVGVLLTVTAQLRWVAGADAGYLALGSMLAAAKSGDVGAYAFGRMFGQTKMFPKLSPGKTWMGGAGALFGSGLGGYIALTWGPQLVNPTWPASPWPFAVLYGVAVGIVGVVGDLCESLIKRDVGRKDASNLMPGFGGLLDLLDSVLYAGPIAYILWTTLPLAAWR